MSYLTKAYCRRRSKGSGREPGMGNCHNFARRMKVMLQLGRHCQIYIESGQALTQGPVTLRGPAPNPTRGILVIFRFPASLVVDLQIFRFISWGCWYGPIPMNFMFKAYRKNMSLGRII